MTLIQYIDAHPWWTLLYLFIICVTVSWSAESFGPLIVISKEDQKK